MDQDREEEERFSPPFAFVKRAAWFSEAVMRLLINRGAGVIRLFSAAWLSSHFQIFHL